MSAKATEGRGGEGRRRVIPFHAPLLSLPGSEREVVPSLGGSVLGFFRLFSPFRGADASSFALFGEDPGTTCMVQGSALWHPSRRIRHTHERHDTQRNYQEGSGIRTRAAGDPDGDEEAEEEAEEWAGEGSLGLRSCFSRSSLSRSFSRSLTRSRSRSRSSSLARSRSLASSFSLSFSLALSRSLASSLSFSFSFSIFADDDDEDKDDGGGASRAGITFSSGLALSLPAAASERGRGEG